MSLKLHLSLLLHTIYAQTDIWYEQMNTDPSLSPDWTGTTPTRITANTTNCPAPNDYCWNLNSGWYSRVADTTGFTSVDLTYSIKAVGKLTNNDSCVIRYSTNGDIFTALETIDTDTQYMDRSNFTYSAWAGVAGKPALTISISVSGSGHSCYFNEFRLHGTPVTSAPTNHPSTATKPPTSSPSKPSTSPSGIPTATPSGLPTHPPSEAPSASPVPAPTHIPTVDTTNPTTAPSLNPTAVPSSAPTSSPTVAPTSQTTQPSSDPSGAPSTPPSNAPSQPPTDSPSFSPTIQTFAPTPNPTAKTSCGSGWNKYCYSIDVSPIYRQSMTASITIQDFDYEGSRSYYDVTFNIVGSIACNRPSVSFNHETIDTDGNYNDEYYWVYYSGLTIATCGNIANSCGDYNLCLNGYSVNSGLPVSVGSSVVVSVTRGSEVSAMCDGHWWAINAIVTLTCDDTTLSPTTDPTVAPTNSPTAATFSPTSAPTAPPTATPTDVPTSVTVEPTSAPTDVPSPSPTGSPSQPPTKSPSGSPSAPPSASPTIPTVNPTWDPTLQPTQPTSMPTDAPTRYVECGTYTYCYYRSVEPIAGNLTSETVLIQDIDHYAQSYYDIVIDITGLTDCNQPTLDLTYERIDNYNSYDTIQVSYQGSSITTCPYYVANSCTRFWTCLDGYTLPSIIVGDTVTIRVTKSINVHAQCTRYHEWAINAELTLTCDDLGTTALPTESPTEYPTYFPTFDPTDPPVIQHCSEDSANGIGCYQQYIYSASSDYISTYRQEIRRADGYTIDMYDVYFTAWYGPCYNPYINVGYRSMVSTNGLTILNNDDTQIGTCATDKDCYVYAECLTSYDLGLQVLQYKETYRVTLLGRNLQNLCDGTSYSNYTTDAYVELVCGILLTSTTGAPTMYPTTHVPTQPKADASESTGSLGGGAIAAVVIVILLLLIGIVLVTTYVNKSRKNQDKIVNNMTVQSVELNDNNKRVSVNNQQQITRKDDDQKVMNNTPAAEDISSSDDGEASVSLAPRMSFAEGVIVDNGNMTRNAMKNDKIALGIVTTRE